jgi:hypothetical protein
MHKTILFAIACLLSFGICSTPCCEVSQSFDGEVEVVECVVSLAATPRPRSSNRETPLRSEASLAAHIVSNASKQSNACFDRSHDLTLSKRNGFGGYLVV